MASSGGLDRRLLLLNSIWKVTQFMNTINGSTEYITAALLVFHCFLLIKTYGNFYKKRKLMNREFNPRLIEMSASDLAMWRLLVVAFFAVSSVLALQDCKIKIHADDKNAKVYFNVFHWTRPKHSFGAAESIKHGSIIKFTCESGFISEGLVDTSYNFQCTDGKFNKTLEYDDLLCRATYHKPTEVSQISPVQFGSRVFKCDKQGWQAYRVYAKKGDKSSRLLYTVCFDTTVLRTKFVFQPRNKEVAGKPNTTRSDVWGLDKFGKNAHEKVKLTEGYVPKIQQDRITKAFPDKYNPQHKYPYTFNRGHLAPYADFIDLEDKRASCQYINVAPQWKEFNSNSWSLVERETRDMVKSNPYDWEIYTGTYSSIPTTKGPLFVSPLYDKDGKYIKSFVPVPKLYWKVVYNLVDKSKSKAFIGINNPELRSPAEFTEKYVICKPIPDKNGNKFQGSEFKGFTYQCQLEEFLEKLRADEQIIK